MMAPKPQNMFRTVKRLGTTARVIFTYPLLLLPNSGQPAHRRSCEMDQDGFARHDPVVEGNFHNRFSGYNDIHARSKFDHAKAFAEHRRLPDFKISHNSPGHGACYLFKQYFPRSRFNPDVGALVLFRRFVGVGKPEFTRNMLKVSNPARNREPVHMDVERGHEDADLHRGVFEELALDHLAYRNNPAVGR